MASFRHKIKDIDKFLRSFSPSLPSIQVRRNGDYLTFVEDGFVDSTWDLMTDIRFFHEEKVQVVKL